MSRRRSRVPSRLQVRAIVAAALERRSPAPVDLLELDARTWFASGTRVRAVGEPGYIRDRADAA